MADAGAPASRPDGTVRPPQKRPREGYTPEEEVERYVAPRPARCQGTVVDWSLQRGYGFIKPDDLSANVFAHHTDLVDVQLLEPLDIVEFERRRAADGENSDRALNIRRIGNSAAGLMGSAHVAGSSSSVGSGSGGGGSGNGGGGGGGGSSSKKKSTASVAALVPRSVAAASRGLKARASGSAAPKAQASAASAAASTAAAAAAAAARRRAERPADAGVLGWF